MKKVNLFFVLFVLGTITMYSAPLTVSWAEGSVMIRTGTTWKELDVGSVVESSEQVQLKPNSFVEFSYSGGKLVLSAEGTYVLDKILANAVKQQAARSSMLSKIGKLVANEVPLSTTVAGVRGSEQDRSSSMNWIVDEELDTAGTDPASNAYELLRGGSYLEAAASFEQLIPNASAERRVEYQYTQAWCLASANDLVASIKLLRSMSSAGPFAIPRALLLARLNLDTGAIGDAVRVLESVRLSPELQNDDRLLVQNMLQEAKTLQGR
ncbi:hypothetical protein [Gracilinema caldarium]|uniref:hypothetical protein n=1 Tax=Gracilinema caldarium TaxID=215591 RepID=UPI0026EFF600|nr:hypothetical protein [Gracilinema caldarium]